MDRRAPAVFVAVLVLATAGRLWLGTALPLLDDEAYYWAWAQRPAWGYPDHPPAIAALIGSTTALLGDTALGVRVGAVLLSAGTALLFFDLGRMMFGATAGALAAITYHVIPAFAVGGIFAFPDAPFVFSWMLALWALWRARTWGRPLDWYLTGLGLGLAAASKVSAVFLAVSLVGFLWATPSERHWWRRPEPYRAAAIALAVLLPVISWNAAHGWITVAKAREPTPWISTGVPALNAAAFIGAQVLYYGPLNAPLLVLALGASASGGRRVDPRYTFILWSAGPIISLTWAASFDGIPKPHWHAPGFLIALIAAAALWLPLRSRPLWRFLAAAAIVANLVVIGTLVALPFQRGVPGAGQIWGWDQVASAVEPSVRATSSTPGRFVMTSRYQTAGQLEFYLRERTLVTTPFGGDAYGLWVSKQHFIDWNAIYLNDLPSGPGVPLARMFRRVESLPPIEVMLDGRVVRRFFVWRGFEFRGMPRPVALAL